MAKKHDAKKVPNAKITCDACGKLKVITEYDWMDSSAHRVDSVGMAFATCKKCMRKRND